MKLLTRTIVTFFLGTICLVGIVHTVSHTIILNSYIRLENEEESGTVQQISSAMDNQYSALNAKLTDWASWDDTYKFVQNNNSAYIESNLTPASLNTFGVSYLLFYNSTGGLVYGIGVDLGNSSKMPVPQSVLSVISATPQVLNFPKINSNFTGLAVVPEGPIILASQPILTSEGKGPVEGTLVFARWFDSQYLQQFSATTRIPLSEELYSNWQESNPVSTYISIPPSTYIHPVNADSIAGYYMLNDIHGLPALVLGTIQPRSVYQQGLTTLNYVDLSVGVVCVVFSIAMLLLAEGFVLSRLRKLVTDVVSITSHDDLSAKVTVSGNDEIATLSGSINGMLGELEKKTAQLTKAERFSAIGELATMVAHDLRNPLQGISNAAFYLKRTKGPSASAKEIEMLALIEDDVIYSDKIVNDLLDYSRNIRLELTETNPRLLLKETLSTIKVPENVHLQDETDDSPTLKLDVDKIRRTFTNIINNAIDAMPDGGPLLIRARKSGQMIDFVFTDGGAGMDKEVQEKIFTPLYTTKAKGMGFGLSISKRIVEAHGGHISVESAVGKGTTFTISLPLNIDSRAGENY